MNADVPNKKYQILADMKHFGCLLRFILARCRISASFRLIFKNLTYVMRGLNRSIYYKSNFQYEAHGQPKPRSDF